MRRIKILALTFLTTFLLLMAKINGIPLPPQQGAQSPLCVSQFALANYACATVPASTESDIIFPRRPHRYATRPHRHRHRHATVTHETTAESCCRWLSDVDKECVCDLLLRLPSFLARPAHQLTIVIGDSCSVTFSCNGRMKP